MGVVIGHLRAALMEQADDVERRTLADVVDVLLVGHAQQQHPAAARGFALLVECVDHLSHPELRHLGVQLAGELDEAGLVIQGPHLPREIVGIERDAVPAHARSRGELHEPERLRRRRLDHFPHVDTELVAHDRHFIGESDVHAAERVLENLHELGRFGG